MQNEQSMVVPFFKSVAVEIPAASKAEGRPIFKDVEVVEIRLAGERNYAPTFPAHEIWKHINGEPVTYADRFSKEYALFAAGKEQVADGTPLSELTFLTEGERATLRRLKVYTAEALASLEGPNLKNLGPKAREFKSQAEAYLNRASGAASSVALAAEVEALKAQIAAMNGEPAAPVEAPADDAAEIEQIKEQIREATGQRPRGNPSLTTLREMLADTKQVA
tara:strand:+ start:781 stop:1446 length:666 start_codon:yes stop_codon:yes gene_type:complete